MQTPPAYHPFYEGRHRRRSVDRLDQIPDGNLIRSDHAESRRVPLTSRMRRRPIPFAVAIVGEIGVAGDCLPVGGRLESGGLVDDLPEGVDKKGYVKLTAAAKGAAPAWAEEDIFVV